MLEINAYNDYVNMTKGYLRNYNKFIVAAKNLSNDIVTAEQFLVQSDDIAAAVAKYGDEPGGGSSELTTVEAAAERHMDLQRNIVKMKRNLSQLQRLIAKIDRALESLDSEDRAIVQEFTIENKSAIEVANRHFYSERWVRTRAKNAMKEIALMIFGIKARPTQLTFVFAD